MSALIDAENTGRLLEKILDKTNGDHEKLKTLLRALSSYYKKSFNGFDDKKRHEFMELCGKELSLLDSEKYIVYQALFEGRPSMGPHP